jgi:cellulose synthase/poly-beta-1,6-N-acetylglucosamine synthase-like glycosyltransferase
MVAAQFETPVARRRRVRLPPADGRSASAKPSPLEAQLHRAVNDLRRRAPDMSAATPLFLWQQLTLFAIPAVLTASLILLQGAGLFLWALTLALPFLMIALVRLAAVWHTLKRPLGRRRRTPFDRRFDARLPTCSVLLPLYREWSVVPTLVEAMARLDYPSTRFEVLFITEADDYLTRQALAQAGLRANMRILTVPDGQPKTKPRALNFALQDARGTLVAVFDAEDMPEAGQLRRAADAFIDGGPRLACVQARLAVYNADESFLSRQFALEYSALFRGLLPALGVLKLPMPLGGTSNHFRRDLLLKIDGWDPFNVTEDADLGIRLARYGYGVSVIDSVTLEEAPATWHVWCGQRTRWIKGWIQTYLVHMRRPLRLWRDLGTWRFVGFQITIGAMVLSMLVHPWFYILALLHGSLGWRFVPESEFLWWVCSSNLAAGYGAAALLTATTALNSGSPRRRLSVVWLPGYWLALSYAAYRAVLDLIVRPFYWEKTTHGTSRLKPPSRRGRASRKYSQTAQRS